MEQIQLKEYLSSVSPFQDCKKLQPFLFTNFTSSPCASSAEANFFLVILETEFPFCSAVNIL